MVAEREGYQINIIQGDMTKPLPFEDETFDLLANPEQMKQLQDEDAGSTR